MKSVRSPRSAGGLAEQILRRATLLRTLAQCFAYPDAVGKAAVGKQLQQVKPRGTRVRDLALRRSLRSVERVWSTVSEEALRADYARLFLGNGPCPMRETAYGDGRRVSGRPTELADIRGFYAAFGLRPSSSEPDLPDHLCSELEFCSWLLVKLAYAHVSRAAIRRAVTLRALRSFLQDHLGRWPETFAAELRRNDESSPYARLAEIVAQVVRAEARRVRASPKPTSAHSLHDPMQEEHFVCPKPHAPEEAPCA